MGNPTNTTGLHVASIEVGSTANQSSDAFIKLTSLSSAPSSTTSKLYNLNGVLYFESTNLESTGGGGLGSLDDAYSSGRAITMDEGAITLTDATAGTAQMLTLVKSGAGSGNMVDIGVSAALTGNVIDIDLDAGLGAKAIYIDAGAGTRTVDEVAIKHDGDGNIDAISVISTNTGTGSILDFNMNGNGSTDGVINVDMDAAVGAEFIYVDAGAGTRTANLFEVKHDGDGNVDVFSVVDTNTGTGAVFDINMDSTHAGEVMNVDMNAAVGSKFLYVDAGAATRTADLIDVKYDGDGNVDLMNIDATNTGTGAIFDINMNGAGSTGGVFNVDMDAAVGAEVMDIDAGAGTRTANLFTIKHDGDGNVDVMQIDDSNTGTGAVFDINMTGATATGAVIDCDMDAAVARPFLNLDYGAGVRTEDVCQVKFDGTGTAPFWDINITNTGAGGTSDYWDIDIDAVFTGSILDVTYGTAAATGDTISINMGTAVAASALVLAAAGNRTDDLIKIDDTSASNSPVFDINLTGAHTGGVLDISFGTSAAATDAIIIAMGTSVGGSAAVITSTGIRTDDLIKIDDDSTGNSHIFDINMSGIYTGNILDITFGTAAATGNAVNLAMGTNVAGSAVLVTSSATGVANVGAAFDVTHDGNLVAGADIVNITSSGNLSSTSNMLAIEQATGACAVGTYGLYINVTGANIEAIKVDAGAVVFDETLLVSGALTAASTLAVTGATTLDTVLYKDLTEVVAATNVITAAETGSVFFLNSGTEFVSTLPAPAAGLHFTFIVAAAPSGASYTVTTNASANIIKGTVHSSTGGNADSETSGCDTVTFADGQSVAGDTAEFWCDGTNWFVKAFCDSDTGITFDTAS